MLDIRRCAGLAAALALALPAAAGAQVIPMVPPDAALVPRGALRITATTAWTRWEERYTDGQRLPLAAGFATDSLGAAALPALAPAEDALRALTGDTGTRLNVGRLRAVANGRVVTVPIVAELGLTDRLSIGVLVPFVQTRATLTATLNPDTAGANVGPNPRAFGTNDGIVSAMVDAAADLRAEIARCQAAPGDPTCATIVARQAEATALADALDAFAGGVTTLYGIDVDQGGMAVVPRVGSAPLLAANARMDAFNTTYSELMGRQVTALRLGGAAGPAGEQQLRELLAEYAGLDSLDAPERIWVGDVEVGVGYRLGAAAGGSSRTMVRAALRVPTGQVARGERIFDVGTGEGHFALDASVASDLRRGRVGASLAARYVARFGSVEMDRAPNADGGIFPLRAPAAWERTAGHTAELLAAPRLFITDQLSVSARYAVRMRGDDAYTTRDGSQAPVTVPGATEQRAGFGFTYAASGATVGTVALPIEVSYNHLATFAASGGPALRLRDDVIRVRLYFARR